MSSDYFVAESGGGYIIHWGGELLGTYPTQEAAEGVYRSLSQQHPALHEAACVRANEMADYWNPGHLRPGDLPWWSALSGGLDGTFDEIAAIWAPSLEGAIAAWQNSPLHNGVLDARVSDWGLCQGNKQTWVAIVRR